MAEKYTLFLDFPQTKDVAIFLKDVSTTDSRFVLESMVKYMDFPTHFNFYCKNFNLAEEKGYRLEEMNQKMRKKMGSIDFFARVVLPENFDGILDFKNKGYVQASLESGLLEKPINVAIYKEKKKFRLYLDGLKQ